MRRVSIASAANSANPGASSGDLDFTAITAKVTRSGVRLDVMVAEACNCGRRQAREFIREGRVFVDGGLLAGGRRLRTGQEVRVIG